MRPSIAFAAIRLLESAGYTVVVVGSNASNTSRNWGRWYAWAVAEQFGTQVGGDGGLLVGGWNGRGDGNVKHTKMPAVLLEPLFASNPQRIMDIGANTGKFSLAALGYQPQVELLLVDLPQQLAVADKNLQAAGVRQRAHLCPVDMLQAEQAFPSGADLIWMSQFLSCFSEAVIASILQRAAAALAPNGQVLIMDTFWDRQKYDIAAYCLINTSPYFTAIASGNSKVYESSDYIRLCEAAGLKLLT